jgi:hypothetical protein
VNELAMNFPSQRIDHGYLKVLVVAETLVAEVPGEHAAVFDRFNVVVELNSNPVSQRNAIFHIEEKCLHRHHLVCSGRPAEEKSPARGGHMKWFAEAPRLVLNDRYRAFQGDSRVCGGTARVDEHNQLADMGRCPLPAADAHHAAQSGVSGLVPKSSRELSDRQFASARKMSDPG